MTMTLARFAREGRIARAWIGALLFIASAAPASAQVWLLDFGASNSFRGASQVGPDANGNVWNSMPPTFYVADLLTSGSVTTGAAHAPGTGSPGTDSYNGLLGTNVSNPLTQQEVDAAVLDAAALGLLGGSKAAAVDYQTATQGRFAIKWLNTNLKYDATFFGSYMWAAEDTRFAAFSDDTYATEVAAASLDVGRAGVANNSRTVTLRGLVPTANDAAGRQLAFQYGGVSGSAAGYLNSMSLYGYLGYLSGTTALNAASPYIANGTYSNGDPRSADSLIGNGATVQVNNADGIYWNSTLVAGQGGGTVDVGLATFGPYALSGSGALSVTGTGVLSLFRPGTFTGTLAVNGGKVSLSGSGALGSGGVALAGGVLRLSSSQAIGAGGIAAVSGVSTIENTGALDGLVGSLPITLGDGATFQVWGNSKQLSLGTGAVGVSGFTNVNAWDGGVKFDGPLVGSGTINWYGSGSLTLGGSSSAFTGRVIAGGNNGTLNVANPHALQSAVLTANAAHTVALSGSGVQTYALRGLTGSGAVGLGSHSLSIATTGPNSFSGVISGSGGVSVAGSGNQVLSGVNTYTGATAVHSGRLTISGGGINDSAAVTISGGEFTYNSSTPLSTPVTFTAGVLSGTGPIAAAVAVGGGATLSPGNSPGVQAFTSGLDWLPAGVLVWEVNALSGTAGVNWDAVAVSGGALDLSGLSAAGGGTFAVNLVTLTGANAGGPLDVGYVAGSTYEFPFASYTSLSLPSGFSTAAGTDLTDLFSFGLGNWQGNQPNAADLRVMIDATGSGLNLAIVPEPSACVLVVVGLAAVACGRHRGLCGRKDR